MSTKHRRFRVLRWFGAATVIAGLACGTTTALAASFNDPPVFASRNGVLDILMIAKAKPIPTISFTPPHSHNAINPIGWVYEICKRPASGLTCPAGTGTSADYGGVRLALQKGDTLKIRFVNRLPKVNPNKLNHLNDPGQANLFRNPTNLHTHGILTPARAATVGNPTFGDFPFVTIYNSANGVPVPQSTHQHGPIVMDTVDYQIPIPANHPSGLFWFHPHVHGIALNQIVQGMAGVITIGNVGDFARGDVHGQPFPESNVRYFTLKETEVLAAGTVNFDSGPQPVANGEVLNQEDPDFCAQFPGPGEVRRGFCPGQDNSADEGNNFTGGKWYFTVNGVVFPTATITAPDGELWRLTSAAGSLSYDLQLINDANGRAMIVQLVSVDGVSINLPQDTPMDAMMQMTGAKFRVVPCPPVQNITTVPVCIDELVMMPSSRAELWVTYRDRNGRVVTPPSGASATLKMIGLTMGSGDSWPAVDLAKVQFNQSGPRNLAATALDIRGEALATMQTGGIFTATVPGAKAAPLPAGCAALPQNHRRRIFFGFSDVNAEGETFALGYEEVDENGNPVPGTQKPGPDQLEQFDPSHNTVCLPLGPGQTPVHETWELVQLATENHNFHMHQSRFRTINTSAASSSLMAARPNPSTSGAIIQDNIPMGVATPSAAIADQVNNNQGGVCTIPQWRSGQCTSPTVVLDIPFSQLGEFVYHCHILEHEDGGMMAKIQVVPSPH